MDIYEFLDSSMSVAYLKISNISVILSSISNSYELNFSTSALLHYKLSYFSLKL